MKVPEFMSFLKDVVKVYSVFFYGRMNDVLL